MANVTIDGKEYDLDSLSAGAKNQLSSIQFVEAEIKRLEAQIAVFKTAYNGYVTALKNEIGE